MQPPLSEWVGGADGCNHGEGGEGCGKDDGESKRPPHTAVLEDHLKRADLKSDRKERNPAGDDRRVRAEGDRRNVYEGQQARKREDTDNGHEADFGDSVGRGLPYHIPLPPSRFDIWLAVTSRTNPMRDLNSPTAVATLNCPDCIPTR